MIFLFHSLYFFYKFMLELYHKHQAIREFRQLNLDLHHEQVDVEPAVDTEACSPLFDPPVYRQRYFVVQNVLSDYRKVKKVVEFGCAELSFFQYLKNLDGVREILEVDVDREVLLDSKYRIQPLTADYLIQRSNPLIVKILNGSVSDPDYRLKDADAVVAIELIEHLYPDTLDALPYNIFGYVNPQLVIFTTPNADFNILFPNFKGFRHDDHKFEWSRAQFEDWATNLILRYPEYSVHFEGIGKGPVGTESLGCCSQMAVFRKQFSIVDIEVPKQHSDRPRKLHQASYGVCNYYSYSKQLSEFEKDDYEIKCGDGKLRSGSYYKLIESVKYPYTEDKRTPEEKIRMDATYFIFMNLNVNSRFFNEDSGFVEIPLYKVVASLKEYNYISIDELSTILTRDEFTIEECVPNGSEVVCPCVVYDINMDPSSSEAPSESDRSETDYNPNTGNESDWELDVVDTSKIELDLEKKSPNAESPISPLSNADPSDLLFDSGYQKSNPESPLSPLEELEQHFGSKIDVNDIKDTVKPNHLKGLNFKQMNNKLCSEKSNNPGSSKKSSPPGISDPKKKQRKSKWSEDSSRDDVRNIANCIVYNSLNRLNIVDDAPPQEPIPLPPIPPPLPIPVIQPPPLIPVIQPIPLIVENGDLANNNRDNEGNNYPDDVMPLIEPIDADIANENRAGNVVQAGVQDQENRNDVINAHLAQAIRVVPLVDYDDDDDDDEPAGALKLEDFTLNHASREALFDPNSQLDMLEDYVIPELDSREELSVPVLVVNVNDEDDADVNPFPNWLLQLLGQPADEDENNRDEPHFYCQGDGLGIFTGVHPSIVEVDVDDSSSDTSSNDDAQAEQAISETDDVGTLPTDSISVPLLPPLEVVGMSLPVRATASALSNNSNEEYFDTLSEPPPPPPNCPPNT